MRVIGGEFRSRRLKTLPGLALRPTPDRLREALFNVLAGRLARCVFVDAYAGCGAVGIEALSRGAARAVFLEKHPGGLRVIRENLAALGLEGRGEVVPGNAAALLGRYPAGIVFVDPPYEQAGEYAASLRVLGGMAPRLAIVQHASRFELAGEYGRLKRCRVLRQGDNTLSFYEAAVLPIK